MTRSMNGTHEWDSREQWPEEELFCESRWQGQKQRSIGGSMIGNRCKINKMRT
jgi:hypothetical protein